MDEGKDNDKQILTMIQILKINLKLNKYLQWFNPSSSSPFSQEANLNKSFLYQFPTKIEKEQKLAQNFMTH